MDEFKKNDVIDVKIPDFQSFQKIQPLEGTTLQEANQHWNNEISNLKNEDMSSEIYTDDNGKEYRVGDNLIPDNHYEFNGYSYETDSQGRISSAEGQLRMRSSDYERNHVDKIETLGKGDEKEGDQRGHLIAHMFGGGDNLENEVPMSGELNQGDYAKMERTLSEAVNDGATVTLKVEPIYKNDSNRPDEVRVTYSIDGDKTVQVFRNGGED